MSTAAPKLLLISRACVRILSAPQGHIRGIRMVLMGLFFFFFFKLLLSIIIQQPYFSFYCNPIYDSSILLASFFKLYMKIAAVSTVPEELQHKRRKALSFLFYKFAILFGCNDVINLREKQGYNCHRVTARGTPWTGYQSVTGWDAE